MLKQMPVLRAEHGEREAPISEIVSGTSIDASDDRVSEWLGSLPSRQELVVRIALRDRGTNLGPHWEPRINALMHRLHINTAGKKGRLLSDVRNAGPTIDAFSSTLQRGASEVNQS